MPQVQATPADHRPRGQLVVVRHGIPARLERVQVRGLGLGFLARLDVGHVGPEVDFPPEETATVWQKVEAAHATLKA